MICSYTSGHKLVGEGQKTTSAVVPKPLTTVFPSPLLVLCLYFGVRVFYWLGTHQIC